MNNSAFLSPSPRQVELQRQMTLAQQLDDQRLMTLLQVQWVHRYGVATLPSLQEEEPAAVVEPIAVEEEPVAVVEPIAVEEEPVAVVEPIAVEEKPVAVVEPIAVEEEPFPVEQIAQSEPISEGVAADNLVVPAKTLGRVATFFKGCLDEVSSTLSNDETPPLDKLGQGQACLDQGVASPPPPPSIKHLRRWLPATDDALTKAS
ncbi:MAG: hypothetical protein AB8B70_00260 [Prochlorococcus sp.]